MYIRLNRILRVDVRLHRFVKLGPSGGVICMLLYDTHSNLKT